MKKFFAITFILIFSASVMAQSSGKIRQRNLYRVKAAIEALEDSVAYLHVDKAVTADYQFQDRIMVQVLNFLADTSAADDDYGGTIYPAPDSLNTGMMVIMKAGFANTGASTLAFNGLTEKAIKTASGADPANSDITTTGISLLVYNGTNWILLNPATTTD